MVDRFSRSSFLAVRLVKILIRLELFYHIYYIYHYGYTFGILDFWHTNKNVAFISLVQH